MRGPASFPKREHLVSLKLTDQLFKGGNGKSMAVFPVRMVWMLCPRTAYEEPVQVLVSVSKRHFKHAVDRNRVKRQLREAYRHSKTALAEAMERRPEEAIVLALIWMTDKHRRSEKVAQGVAQLLRQLQEKLDAGSPVS